MTYTPLHVYSGYSLLKSGLHLDEYLDAAKKMGLTNVGISDFATLTSAPVIYHEAEKRGLRVVLGEDLVIENLLFSFYVLNEKGYQNLLKLSLKVEKGNNLRDVILEYNEVSSLFLLCFVLFLCFPCCDCILTSVLQGECKVRQTAYFPDGMQSRHQFRPDK